MDKGCAKPGDEGPKTCCLSRAKRGSSKMNAVVKCEEEMRNDNLTAGARVRAFDQRYRDLFRPAGVAPGGGGGGSR